MNIIRNGDFSSWSNNNPCDWKLSGGTPIAAEMMATNGKFNLQVREFDENDFIHEKILSQTIKLSPYSKYRLDLKMYAAHSFYLKVRLSNKNGKTVSEKDMGWFGFLYWQKIPVELDSASEEEYLLEIVFNSENKKPGCPAFEIDSICMSPEDAPGLIVFTHSIMQSYEEHIPAEAVIQPHTILQTALRKEYHPLVIGIKSDRDISSVQFSLVDPDVLDSSGIEIRRLKKQLLTKEQPTALQAGQIQRWWITFSPAVTADPGIFRLKFKITADNHEQIISIDLKILDIILPETDIPMLVYFSERYIPGEMLSDDLRRKYYTDMREHGMTSATIYNNPDSEDSDKPDFSHNWQFSQKEQQWFREKQQDGMLAKETDFALRFNWGLEQEMNALLENGLCSSKFPVIWLVGKKTLMSENLDTWGKMSSPSKIEQSIKHWLEHKNWPEPLYQIVDEPDGLENRIEAARDIFSSLENIKSRTRTITANVSPGELGDKYDVWVQPAYRISEKYKQAVAKYNSELWVYDCATSNCNMALSRSLYGFWAQLSGVKGVAQWAYYDAFADFADNHKEPDSDNSFATLSRVGLSPDGPVATLAWEATREGTVDFRVCKLFRRYYKKLKEKYNKTGTGELKEQLKVLLEQIEEVDERVLQSVPLEAFAAFKAECLFYERLMFKPVVGPGNPDLAAEVKRQALLPHIIQMKNILGE